MGMPVDRFQFHEQILQPLALDEQFSRCRELANIAKRCALGDKSM